MKAALIHSAFNLACALVILICGLLLGWHLGVVKGHAVVKKRGYAVPSTTTGELVWVDDGTPISEGK